jgi:hypothetical protein
MTFWNGSFPPIADIRRCVTLATMSGPPERLKTSEPITAIREAAQACVQVLGVDGFEVVPDGHVAALDLLLDVSGRNLTAAEAAAEAETFVRSRGRSDVLWEVWTELT